MGLNKDLVAFMAGVTIIVTTIIFANHMRSKETLELEQEEEEEEQVETQEGEEEEEDTQVTTIFMSILTNFIFILSSVVSIFVYFGFSCFPDHTTKILVKDKEYLLRPTVVNAQGRLLGFEVCHLTNSLSPSPLS